MPVEVIMPKVDMDMERGRILGWLSAEGTKVNRYEPLFEIETAKAALEVESPATGILGHILAPVGSEVEIGCPVAWIYAEGETVGDPPVATGRGAPETQESAVRGSALPEGVQENGQPREAGPQGVRATPAARCLAAERGITIGDVRGTGPRGRVQRADVEREPIGLVTTLAAARDSVDVAPGGGEFRPLEAAQRGALSILRTGGGSGLPFVLRHGFAADASIWTALEALLTAGNPVIRIETPCHGRSPVRRVDSFAGLVEEILGAFDALGVDAAYLVGHSLGGAVALAVADRRPKAVRSLALLCPAGLGPEINGAAVRGISAASKPESLCPCLKRLAADPDRIDGSYIRAATAARGNPALRAAQAELAETLFPDGVQGFDLTGILARVGCPACIIWGKQDSMIPWEHALQAPGRVSVNLFEGAGHFLHWEAANDIALLLRRQAIASGDPADGLKERESRAGR